MPRISTIQEHSAMVASLQEAMGKRQAEANRVASGRAFNQPSDDPLAAVRLAEVNRHVAALSIYLEKISALNNTLAHEDTMVQEYIRLVGQARDIFLYANNGSLGAADLIGLGESMGQIKGSLISVLNARTPDGVYLFGGLDSYRAPVVIDPSTGRFSVNNRNAGQRRVMVTETASVAAADSALALCFAVADGSGGTLNGLEVIQGIQDLLFSGQSLPQDPFNTLLNQLDRVAGHADGIQTNLGLRMNTLATTRAELEQYQLSGQQLASELEGLDYAAAITRLNQYLLAVEAARKSLATVGTLSLFQFIYP